MDDAKNKGGRPRAIPRVPVELRTKVIELARAGHALEVVAEYLDIGRSTLFGALARAEEARERRNAGEELSPDDQAELDFCSVLRSVRAEVAMKHETKQQAGGPDWKASAWLLERRYPDVYSARSKTEITGADGGPVNINAAVVILPELDNAGGSLAPEPRAADPVSGE